MRQLGYFKSQHQSGASTGVLGHRDENSGVKNARSRRMRQVLTQQPVGGPKGGIPRELQVGDFESHPDSGQFRHR